MTIGDRSPDFDLRSTVGVTGMIFGLLSVMTCGILSPIALVLSLAGLARPPRGYAVAGIVLSFVGLAMGWYLMATFASSPKWSSD